MASRAAGIGSIPIWTSTGDSVVSRTWNPPRRSVSFALERPGLDPLRGHDLRRSRTLASCTSAWIRMGSPSWRNPSTPAPFVVAMPHGHRRIAVSVAGIGRSQRGRALGMQRLPLPMEKASRASGRPTLARSRIFASPRSVVAVRVCWWRLRPRSFRRTPSILDA